MLPKNWVHFLLGVKLKDTAKSKSSIRNDLLLAASKDNIGGLKIQGNLKLN